jgi:hypothetical protein
LEYRPEDVKVVAQEVQGETKTQAESGSWGGSSAGSRNPLGHLSDEELESLTFPEFRDKLIAFDPLNKAHIVKVWTFNHPTFKL